MMRLIVNTDGGARGNPGPAGIGAVIRREKRVKSKEKKDEFEVIQEISEYVGEATNNQAEYRALIKALEIVCDEYSNVDEIEFRLDSELVVKQINGEYKMKNEGLRPLLEQVKNLLEKIDRRCVFVHVRREKNQEADTLVNKAIDRVVGI